MSDSNKLHLYFLDTETTGLEMHNSIIELSIIRFDDGSQRSWNIKADEDEKTIQPEALRINGHTLDDIMHRTASGRQMYQEPQKVIAEVENWLMEDGIPSDKRIIAGQNVSGFDKDRILNLWKKYGYMETFPFNPRLTCDTLQTEIFLNVLFDKYNERFNLGSLVEKYKVKKLKAHTAIDDTIMVRDVFTAQLKAVKDLIKGK